MNKEACENKSALLIILIFYSKTNKQTNLTTFQPSKLEVKGNLIMKVFFFSL